MSLSRTLHGAAWLSPLLALGLALGGCSVFHRHGDSAAPPAPMSAAADNSTPVAESAEPQTVTSNLPDVEPESADMTAAGATTTVMPDASAALSPTAPKSYVVQKGDTLWRLANLFLKDPWLWPEIWYVNPEVSNPHRIYPGDTLRLAKGGPGQAGGQAVAIQLQHTGPVTRLEPLLRSTELEAPIANIPYSAIAAFLSRPGVLTKAQAEASPYVLALRDRHLIAGAGNDVYVSHLKASEGERFNVLHIADKLKDPDGHESLGYMAVFSGVAQVMRAGEPARVQIIESEREILAGDVLVPETTGNVGDLVPRSPRTKIHGRIVAVVNGVLLAGQFQSVALNRGSADGLEPGHVLRVNESQQTVHDRCARVTGNATCTHFGDTKLPIEAVGTLLVYRVYDHVSYALVARESIPLSVGDHVVTP
ncbi:MAG TPA: LysM peptidoglycan-binding domain-containing protein [Steroidobacteraceae bacterium]|nr:LysM peptidoglycan-binding domain-containing protein [Steroidobacteraceae bacterium]